LWLGKVTLMRRHETDMQSRDDGGMGAAVAIVIVLLALLLMVLG
jgi:hypothetical protein